MNITYKLNQNNNFHLSLKVIQATEVKALKALQEKLKENNKTSIIIETSNCYEILLKAYNEKIDYVLVNSSVNFLLPLVNIITTDDVSIIKPMIPTYYLLKDNKIIQKVKTTCNKKMSTYSAFKTLEELINQVIYYISN